MANPPETIVVDERTGEPADLAVLEETGTAFDPSRTHLDLTKDEKRRTTALMMAVQAYRELIIKEATYLKEMADLVRRGEIKDEDGVAVPALRPATIDAMVEAAIKFDMFIGGEFDDVKKEIKEAVTLGGAQTEKKEVTPPEPSTEQ